MAATQKGHLPKMMRVALPPGTHTSGSCPGLSIDQHPRGWLTLCLSSPLVPQMAAGQVPALFLPPEPHDGFFDWDGPDQNHVAYIRWLEMHMQNEIQRLGGIQDIQNMLNEARQRLSEAVNRENPAMANVDHAERLVAVHRECDDVSIVVDIIPHPQNEGAPANAHMHHFKFRFAGRLAELLPLMNLYMQREQATSARHTTRGINFNAEYERHDPDRARPQWRFVPSFFFFFFWTNF